jgi:hypothetical protein
MFASRSCSCARLLLLSVVHFFSTAYCIGRNHAIPDMIRSTFAAFGVGLTDMFCVVTRYLLSRSTVYVGANVILTAYMLLYSTSCKYTPSTHARFLGLSLPPPLGRCPRCSQLTPLDSQLNCGLPRQATTEDKVQEGIP